MQKTFDPATGQWLVEFSLPAEAGAEQAWVCGDWNDWDTEATRLESRSDGWLAATVALPPGTSFRFRYYLGNGAWENDWNADDYVDNSLGGTDSLVILDPAPDDAGDAAGTIVDSPPADLPIEGGSVTMPDAADAPTADDLIDLNAPDPTVMAEMGPAAAGGSGPKPRARGTRKTDEAAAEPNGGKSSARAGKKPAAKKTSVGAPVPAHGEVASAEQLAEGEAAVRKAEGGRARRP